jgi:hypothetical protein
MVYFPLSHITPKPHVLYTFGNTDPSHTLHAFFPHSITSLVHGLGHTFLADIFPGQQHLPP